MVVDFKLNICLLPRAMGDSGKGLELAEFSPALPHLLWDPL